MPVVSLTFVSRNVFMQTAVSATENVLMNLRGRSQLGKCIGVHSFPRRVAMAAA